MRTAYGDEWQKTNFASWSNVQPQLVAYRESGLQEANDFVDWKNFAKHPYVSTTHGNRFVVNHVNDAGAEAYGRFEEIGKMPAGGIVAKPSFTVTPQGQAQLGPLFLMEKMEAGFDPDTLDWRYTLVMPDGTIGGRTQGQNAQAVAFCAECHNVAEAQDALLFLPDEVRVK